MKIKACEFTIFDVETTGLFPYSGDRICEIAAIRVNSSCKRPKKFSSLVDPGRQISYGAFRVNRITGKMLGGKPDVGVKLMDQALESAKRGMLITQLLYAQYCAPAVQDKKLFYSLTNEIEKANIDTIKDAILINMSVKMKAPVIKRSVKDLFID